MTSARTAIALFAAAAAVACAGTLPAAAQGAPEPAKPVELARYLGRWYEIARYPNSFERGCREVTAEYSLRKGGGIRVLNTCWEGGFQRRTRQATGRARVVGADGAKLKVSFFPIVWSDYWVLDRADDYSWALVGDRDRKLFWILARSPNPRQLEAIVARAEELGYRRERLIWSGTWARADRTST